MRVAPLLLLCVMLSCARPTDPPLTDPAAFVVDATVVYHDLEGGCWSLRFDSATGYQAANLPAVYRHDGLSVRAAVKFRDDLMSFCQIGRIIEVLWIRRR